MNAQHAPVDAGAAATPCNIAASLPRLARERPTQVALRCPGRDGRYPASASLDYATLDARSDAIAAGLAGFGVQAGTRCVVMVRPTPEFFLLMFALFKRGAVPVLVDPGIPKRALRQCLAEAEPEAFIGIPLAHIARLLLGWAPSTRLAITTGKRGWGVDATLAAVERAGQGAGPQLAATQPDDTAAIVFTSGSTGIPKGVVYRHRHFVAQIELLGRAFGIAPGGVDLPTFPPFALFDPALGLTSVIPDMDPTRPAAADPLKLHAAMQRFGVSQLFGSPALMRVLAEHGAPLPGLARVTSAGAPVPPDTVARLQALLPADAQFWTPYGATECLPVSVIEGRELIALRARTEQGAGTCVGRPVVPNVVRIIAIDDGPIEAWHAARELPAGVVGEITVAGPSATDRYFRRDAQTRLAKIREALAEDGERIVHRMGDVGYFDAEGRLWFCGRMSQRVATAERTLHTEQVEPVFNAVAGVRRTALVGVGERGRQQAWLVVEPAARLDRAGWRALQAALHARARGAGLDALLAGALHHRKPLPVDIRHNAKIQREALAVWATRAVLRR
jgi:acyl-CoA synthetase (AMP-forming)/AMP-acid ligase II